MMLVATLGIAKAAEVEIRTLFTTPEERQIINANRYKTEEIVKPRVVAVETAFVAPVVPQEEINKSFAISGITISNSGPHSVWINNQVYEDGERLEDNSHIKVLTDNNIRVRITTPDGKIYYGTSGETVEVVYMGAIQN